MASCKLKLSKNTVHITPEMAAYLVAHGLIKMVKVGQFKSLVKDDLEVWKFLRA